MGKLEFNKRMIIQRNSKIDRNLIEEAEILEKKISEFGGKVKSGYGLTPPLNNSNTFFLNSN